MEVLQVLEKKIAALVELIHELKAENARLVEENAQLLVQVDSLQATIGALEGTVVQDSNRLNELKEETKHVVDDLIRSIDLLVKENQQ